MGYLDDLVPVPLGAALAARMIPAPVLDDCRERAREVVAGGKPVNGVAAAVLVAVRIVLAVLAVLLVGRGARP